MPCGRLVVISGILAGGTLGFRNVKCCFCTFPGPFCDCDVFVFICFTQGPRPFQHTSCWFNSHKSNTVQHDVFVSCSFCLLCFLVFVFCVWVWCFVAVSVFRLWVGWHRNWTDTGLCKGPCSLLILPMRRLSMFLHNSLMQRQTCATTWRKPRRRRTEKKDGRFRFPSLSAHSIRAMSPRCKMLGKELLGGL